MPRTWKHGIISPVSKTCPPRIDQLRPITLLPILAKVFEKHVLSSIRAKILKLVDKNQFGYVPFSSTSCALIHLHDRITKILEDDDNIAAAVLSLDYTKLLTQYLITF